MSIETPVGEARPAEASLVDIKIAITLEEYFDIYFIQGGKSSVLISEDRKLEIMNQKGWESLVYFEDLEGDTETSRLWRLKDWEHHKRTRVEYRNEVKAADLAIAKEKHLRVQQWQISSAARLRSKGVREELIREIIKNAMSPRPVFRKDEFTGKEDKTVIIGFNEIDLKYRKVLNFPED